MAVDEPFELQLAATNLDIHFMNTVAVEQVDFPAFADRFTRCERPQALFHHAKAGSEETKLVARHNFIHLFRVFQTPPMRGAVRMGGGSIGGLTGGLPGSGGSTGGFPGSGGCTGGSSGLGGLTGGRSGSGGLIGGGCLPGGLSGAFAANNASPGNTISLKLTAPAVPNHGE
jgi:hypothetical protein